MHAKWKVRLLYWPAVFALWIHRRVAIPHSLWLIVLGWKTMGDTLRNPCPENAEYRFRMFGDPLTEIPAEVTLCSIRFRVQVSEGLIVFSEKHGFYGTHRLICFERDGDGMLWYMKFNATWEKVPMCHVLRAFEYVRAVYGGDFEIKRPASRPAIYAAAVR